MAKFSRRDAERLPEYERRLEAIADVLRALALQPPPNVTDDGWWKALPELMRAGRLGKRLHALDETLRQELLDLFTISAGEYLDRWFESTPIKAVLGFDGIVGNYASPYTPGSAYVLLHHVFGEVNGVKGAWGHAIGGMGAITQAMAKAAVAAGVEIRTDAGVREVIVENWRASGVVTESGETLRARAVVANVNPKLLYERLMSPNRGARAHPRAHGPLALRFRHPAHERGAVEAARFQRVAGRRRPSHRRHHHGARPGLHGSRLPGCARIRLVARTDRGDADSLHPGRHAGAARASTSPACSASRCSRSYPADAAGTTIATKSPT